MSAPLKNSKNGILGKKVKGFLATKSACRGIFSIVVAALIWEFGTKYGLPVLKAIPPPSAALLSFKESFVDPAYWGSWGNSFIRIGLGFIFAQIIGIPLGLLMGTSRYFRELSLPVFEVLRPIPPLAWVPASALFWPTPEMSIVFVTFLGAFFVTILNIVGGARSIDARYVRAAVSLGSSRRDIFWRIVLPATLPSIIVAMTVHRGLLEHGGGGRDARRPLRPGVSDLAGLCDLHLSLDRGRHDQHRDRRLHFQRDYPDSGLSYDAVAQNHLMPVKNCRG